MLSAGGEGATIGGHAIVDNLSRTSAAVVRGATEDLSFGYEDGGTAYKQKVSISYLKSNNPAPTVGTAVSFDGREYQIVSFSDMMTTWKTNIEQLDS